MVFKLDKNSHKRTPETSDIPEMTILLLDELSEFQDQMRIDKLDPNVVIELCDVSNFAFLMFLALRNQGVADWRNTPEETPCTLGAGCDETGVCYAAAMGKPEQCGRS
jgi:hypothetical protein